MSRFLAAFRASQALAPETLISETYSHDNPEKAGNLDTGSAGSAGEDSFRGFRGFRDHTSGKTAVLTAAARGPPKHWANPIHLDRERAEVAAALAAEAAGDFGPLGAPPEDHRAAVAGLLRGSPRTRALLGEGHNLDRPPAQPGRAERPPAHRGRCRKPAGGSHALRAAATDPNGADPLWRTSPSPAPWRWRALQRR